MKVERFARVHRGFVRLDGEGAEVLDGSPWAGGVATGERLEHVGALTMCPVAPSKIVGVGRNYRLHAEELDNELPKEPLLFFKPSSSLVPTGATVLLPPESERVDYEGELAVVIGRRGRRIPADRALEYVFGYGTLCDVTARDLQKKDGQWARAKGFDGFCPFGPVLVRGVDPSELRIRVTVNGDVRQDGPTRDMVFDVAALVAYISGAMTLEPGDVIATGTPHGVGPLSDGDRVTVDIEGVSSLDFAVARER